MTKLKDDVKAPPFETADLRRNLKRFLNLDYGGRPVGSWQWGVYAFYDYDREPIYVGQTNEKLQNRIRRHLTNQRTDAVAMSVLDPYEVFEIEVYPLMDLEGIGQKHERFSEARRRLDAVELTVFERAISESQFRAVLNEKDPPKAGRVKLPKALRDRVVSDEVFQIRSHPDTRIARRASILSELAHVISERKVSKGLRRTLLTQAKRLEWLAERRFKAVSGEIEEEQGDNV